MAHLRLSALLLASILGAAACGNVGEIGGAGGGDVLKSDEEGGGGGLGSGVTSGSGPATSGTGASAPTPEGGLFEAAEPWNTPVEGLPASPESGAILQWLDQAGGWGLEEMRIDFSIPVLFADADAPFQAFIPTDDFFAPDCDEVPFPLPAGGAIEGSPGYSCADDGDCHLIVVHRPTKRLYEMWRAFTTNEGFMGGCAVQWDLTRAYPQNLRGDGCTSADAGGFPIAALLFTADEIAAGEIPHAIRFILPNSRIRGGDVYVHPGTHTTGATSGGPDAPPYGVRFRLKPDYDLSQLPTEGARVIARAMQRYGMFLADAGQVALTAADDRFTQHKWDEVGVDAYSLSALDVTDFEVVGMDDPVSFSGDCTRNP